MSSNSTRPTTVSVHPHLLCQQESVYDFPSLGLPPCRQEHINSTWALCNPLNISAQSALKYKINSNFLNQKPQNYPLYSAHVLYEINSLTSHPSKWFVSLQQVDFGKTAKSGALASTEHSAMLWRASEADQKAQPWRYPPVICGQVSTDSVTRPAARSYYRAGILCTEVR